MNKLFHIKTQLWPTPGHYLSSQVSPLSLLALQIQFMSKPSLKEGNLLDGNKGLYFFRDSGIPLPRPATFSAWRTLVGIGNEESPFFVVPFLPSIRGDEESGVMGSLRGSGDAGHNHLTTLTRKSRLHLTDSAGRINWGSVYIGRWDHPDDPLQFELSRSDVGESCIIPRKYQSTDPDSKVHGGLRTRLEFLAQFGIPAISASDFPIAPLRRVLFQISSQGAGDAWAKAYCESRQIVSLDSGAEAADWQELIHEIREKDKLPDSETDSLNGVKNDHNLELKKSRKKIKFGEMDLSL